MNIAQAKCIPLEQYLERQGLKPQKSRQGGRELWYHSPIRDGDENPSFKVDTIKNVWFDHGVAEGDPLTESSCLQSRARPWRITAITVTIRLFRGKYKFNSHTPQHRLNRIKKISRMRIWRREL